MRALAGVAVAYEALDEGLYALLVVPGLKQGEGLPYSRISS